MNESRRASVQFAKIHTHTCLILQQHRAISLLQHGFLVYIIDRSNAEISRSTLMLIFTAVTQNHGDSRRSWLTAKITVKVTVIVNRPT